MKRVVGRACALLVAVFTTQCGNQGVKPSDDTGGVSQRKDAIASGSSTGIGASDTTDNFVVALVRGNADDDERDLASCVGVLVSPTTIVSAAHCFLPSDVDCFPSVDTSPGSDTRGSEWDIVVSGHLQETRSDNDFDPDDFSSDNRRFHRRNDVDVVTQPGFGAISSCSWPVDRVEAGQDVAVLRLNHAVPVKFATPIPIAGFLGNPGCPVEGTFSAQTLGFGDVSDMGFPFEFDKVGNRQARVKASSSGWHTVDGYLWQNEWLPNPLDDDWGKGIPRKGDSGGPLVRTVDGTRVVCGVAARYWGHSVTSDITDLVQVNAGYAALSYGSNSRFLEQHLLDERGLLHGTCPDAPPGGITVRDRDDDLIPDHCDPLPDVPDPDYARDGTITVGADSDGDGIADRGDLCPHVADSFEIVDGLWAQRDTDHDFVGDACDCRTAANNTFDFPCCSDDTDCPGAGNECFLAGARVRPEGCVRRCLFPPDQDADGVPDTCDNCPGEPNPGQANADGDPFGNPCDSCSGQHSFGPQSADSSPAPYCTWSQNPATRDAPCKIAHPDATCVIRPYHPSDANSNLGACSHAEADSDGDGIGDPCDSCPGIPTSNAKEPNCNILSELANGVEYPGFGDACDASPCTTLRTGEGYHSGGSPLDPQQAFTRVKLTPYLVPLGAQTVQNGTYGYTTEPLANVGMRLCECDTGESAFECAVNCPTIQATAEFISSQEWLPWVLDDGNATSAQWNGLGMRIPTGTQLMPGDPRPQGNAITELVWDGTRPAAQTGDRFMGWTHTTVPQLLDGMNPAAPSAYSDFSNSYLAFTPALDRNPVGFNPHQLPNEPLRPDCILCELNRPLGIPVLPDPTIDRFSGWLRLFEGELVLDRGGVPDPTAATLLEWLSRGNTLVPAPDWAAIEGGLSVAAVDLSTPWVRVVGAVSFDATREQYDRTLLPLERLDPATFHIVGQDIAINDGVFISPRAPGLSPIIAATEHLQLGVSAIANANLRSRGDIVLRNFAAVVGSAQARLAVTRQAGAETWGFSSANQQDVDVPELDFDPDLTGPFRSTLLVPADAEMNAEPGVYDAIDLRVGSRLDLAPGRYVTNTLRVEPGARISLKAAGQAVRIYVLQELTYNGHVENSNEGRNLLLGYLGQQDIFFNSPFSGTVVAPNVKASFISTPAGHEGSFFAKSLEFHQHTEIRHRPFAFELPELGAPVESRGPLGRTAAGTTVSRSHNSIFVLGGRLLKSNQLARDLWVFSVATGVWNRLPIRGPEPTEVLALTYSAHDDALYYLDELYGGRRLVRYSLTTGVSQILRTWTASLAIGPPNILTDADGRVAIVANVAGQDQHLLWRARYAAGVLADDGGLVLPGQVLGVRSDDQGTFAVGIVDRALGQTRAPSYVLDDMVFDSNIAVGGSCALPCEPDAPTCSDGQQNGEETDVDCGANCEPCPEDAQCSGDQDCVSETCQGGACVVIDPCANLVQDGSESGVDCGGSCQVGCADLCLDGFPNGHETGVDCGGPDCGACGPGQGCEEPSDCQTGACIRAICHEPTCSDGVLNGEEEGVDCGGLCEQSCSCSSSFEAESMFHSTGGSAPGGWNIWSNGYIASTHSFSTDDTELIVIASGTLANGAWPHMVVSVDGAFVGDAYVASDVWLPYAFDLGGLTGDKEIRVSFDNDYYNPPADRNLLVDRVVVACDSVPPEPPAGGGNSCTAESAVDLGGPGTDVTVPNDGCVRIQNGYPSWWGTRTMRVENTSPGAYPISYSWTNSCTSSSGTGTITGDWQAQLLNVTGSACPTVIDLQGNGSGNVTLHYWAN